MRVLLNANGKDLSEFRILDPISEDKVSSKLKKYSDSEFILEYQIDEEKTVEFEFDVQKTGIVIRGTGQLAPYSEYLSRLTIENFEQNSSQVWHDYLKTRLSKMRADDIMHQGLLSVLPNETVGEAVDMMNQYNTGSIVVVDGDQKLKGIFTERDFLRIGQKEGVHRDPISTHMTINPNTISCESSVTEIYHKFRGASFRHLPVVDGDILVGMISMRDLVKYWTKLVEIQRESITMEYEKAMSVIVHDLRSPIYAVKSINELLLSGSEGPDEYCKNGFPNLVNDSCNSMASLINDLLEISTVKAGKVHLECTKHPISQVVDEVVRSFEPSAKEKKMTLKTDYRDFAVELNIDKRRLQQAIQNLISNAIKYSNPGTEIEIETYLEDDHIRVSVTDHGQGIPADELNHVFDELCKVSTKPTAGEPSTGLGLSIAKRIVEAHGGAVSVSSDPGIATTFSYHLPLPTNGAVAA